MAVPIYAHGRTWYPLTSPTLNRNLYDEYLHGKNCDCELISKDGTIIKLHSSVLLESVHPPLISADTKPPKNGVLVLHLNETDDQTIRAFVEYLYIGYDEFLKKFGQPGNKDTPSSCTIPIFALVEFAHRHQQLLLFECCRNIICRVTNKEDVTKVQIAYEKTQNYFLYLHYLKLIK